MKDEIFHGEGLVGGILYDWLFSLDDRYPMGRTPDFSAASGVWEQAEPVD
jgi:hypothetical protein